MYAHYLHASLSAHLCIVMVSTSGHALHNVWPPQYACSSCRYGQAAAAAWGCRKNSAVVAAWHCLRQAGHGSLGCWGLACGWPRIPAIKLASQRTTTQPRRVTTTSTKTNVVRRLEGHAHHGGIMAWVLVVHLAGIRWRAGVVHCAHPGAVSGASWCT